MLPSVFPRLATDSAGRVFPGVRKPLFLKFPSRDGAPSPPPLSLFSSFIFFPYLFSKTMVCFSGCLMSSASLQKLFCGVCSALKCSFEEFVREKAVFPSYSSAILGPPDGEFNVTVPLHTLKRYRRGKDGGGIGREDHFLPHKFLKRTFQRRANSTKQLL